MSMLYPDGEDSEEAREGTASHEIGEHLILLGLNYEDGTVSPKVRENYVGNTASNGVIFTDDMFDAAWEYATEVVREHKSRANALTRVEHRVEMPMIHAESFGTVDAHMYDRTANELIIWDYKYGMGVVEAYENWQGIDYAAGLMREFGIDGELDQVTTVKIAIVQPRAYHEEGTVREWSVLAADLRGYINTLATNANRALSDEAETKSGNHCKHCTARHACSTALEAGIQLFEVAGAPVPSELSDEAMGLQLSIITRARKQLEFLETAYTEQVTAKIKAGKAVSGWDVRNSYGREKWANSVEEVIAMGDMMEKDLRAEQKAITPAQAKKLGLDEDVVKAYSEKPHRGLKLVPENETRVSSVFARLKRGAK